MARSASSGSSGENNDAQTSSVVDNWLPLLPLQIGPEGAIALAAALKVNPVLSYLNLSGTTIGGLRCTYRHMKQGVGCVTPYVFGVLSVALPLSKKSTNRHRYPITPRHTPYCPHRWHGC